MSSSTSRQAGYSSRMEQQLPSSSKWTDDVALTYLLVLESGTSDTVVV